MNLEKTMHYSSLYVIYGELLTKKQQQIVECYIFENLSLGEISENFNISRQAVLDTVNKSYEILKNYEEKLHVLKKNENLKTALLNLKKGIANENLVEQINNIIESVISLSNPRKYIVWINLGKIWKINWI